jgi:Tfp pilus assembly protein PilN
MIALAAVILVVSGMGISRTLKLSAKADDLKEKISSLDKRLAPFVEMSNRLEELKAKQKALSDFTGQTPDILNVLKDIATLTPEDTWIRNFSLTKGKIRISAEGKSATACVSSLRKSRQFSQVKLVSSVTKTKSNNERFSLEIIPRTAGGGGK